MEFLFPLSFSFVSVEFAERHFVSETIKIRTKQSNDAAVGRWGIFLEDLQLFLISVK